MATEVMACMSNWLDDGDAKGHVTWTETYTPRRISTFAVETATSGQSGSLSSYTAPDYASNTVACYHSWPYYPVYVSSPARPIKLALSEVERLRKAAKADEKLKAILQKFTSQIEITVDFE